ncbi:DUF4126 domain-containing protein [Pontibacterium granulatum]|uniref:DUF4126 domain-containing protein n=1 Tax=Pontibacterium granulatum TaxID=2036029 RepID=UPI00249B74B8|nr:DUF4126 domain-containing protein [Pontibacterium granulatum]MDI3322848.1 DUF4126 domain-containing protein [Pontibacterium granulatum]
MDQLDQIVSLIALTMGVGWASGINLYATVLMLGVLSNMGHISLPAELMVVADPLVLMAAGFMYCVEFFADKVPGVDTGWDGLHTFIRIPAGAALASAAVGDISPAVEVAAALVGGSLAAASHATKAGSRVLINTSPEPVTNWTASFTEDVLVLAGLWTALNHPVSFLIALALFIVLIAWLLPKLWRGIKKVFSWLGGLFRGSESIPSAPQLTDKGSEVRPSAPDSDR